MKRWLEMSPKKQFTTLDTHDGIGIVDARDLMPDEAIEETKEKNVHQRSQCKEDLQHSGLQ